jgi:organic radical activating enzyme
MPESLSAESPPMPSRGNAVDPPATIEERTVRGRLPTTVTILSTYRCTAACDNCCFDSSPLVDEKVSGRIPLERMLYYIDQAADLKIRLVVFSGGEPFLLGRELDIAVHHATQHGMLTRCVTNAFWANTPELALRRIRRLQAAGLTELNISTGDYHQQFVSATNVVNGTMAALEMSLTTCIMVESRRGRQFTVDTLLSDRRLANTLVDKKNFDLFRIVESPWMPMKPHAHVDQDDERYVNRQNLHNRGGCDSILSSLVVTPKEHLGACCGLTREQIPELDIGSLREHEMKSLFDVALADFLKVWIFVEGPEHIVAWAATKDPSIEWEGQFAHICDVCRFMYRSPQVRKVIEEHYQEKVLDVLLRFSVINHYEIPGSAALIHEAPTVSDLLNGKAIVS